MAKKKSSKKKTVKNDCTLKKNIKCKKSPCKKNCAKLQTTKLFSPVQEVSSSRKSIVDYCFSFIKRTFGYGSDT